MSLRRAKRPLLNAVNGFYGYRFNHAFPRFRSNDLRQWPCQLVLWSGSSEQTTEGGHEVSLVGNEVGGDITASDAVFCFASDNTVTGSFNGGGLYVDASTATLDTVTTSYPLWCVDQDTVAWLADAKLRLELCTTGKERLSLQLGAFLSKKSGL